MAVSPRSRATLVIGAVVTVHLVMMLGNRGPVLYEDAIGYLGNARALAGGTLPQFDGVNSYGAGYSLLLVPAYLVSQAAEWVWTWSMFLNVLLATLVLLPARWLARNVFDVDAANAWLVAVAVALTPSLMLQAGRAWPETLIPLLMLVGTMGLYRALQHTSPAWAVTTGITFGYLVTVHPRAIVAAALVCAVFAIAPFATRLSAWASAAAVGCVMVGFVASRLLNQHLATQLWSEPPRNSGSLGRVLDALAPDRIGETLLRSAGQSWYVLAVSFGFAAIGVFGWLTLWRNSPEGARIPRALSGAFVVAAVVGTVLVGAAFLSVGSRPDHYVYGRYLDGVSPLLLVAGFSLVVRGGHAMKLAFAGAVTVGLGAILALSREPDVYIGWTQKLSIPGLVVLQNAVDVGTGTQMGAIDVVPISLVSMAVVAGLVTCLRRRTGVAAVIGAVIVTLGLCIPAKLASWDPYVDFWYETANGIPFALENRSSHTVFYDMSVDVPQVRNNYEFRLAPARLTRVSGICSVTGPGYVITGLEQLESWSRPPTPLGSDHVPGLVLVFLEGPPADCD